MEISPLRGQHSRIPFHWLHSLPPVTCYSFFNPPQSGVCPHDSVNFFLHEELFSLPLWCYAVLLWFLNARLPFLGITCRLVLLVLTLYIEMPWSILLQVFPSFLPLQQNPFPWLKLHAKDFVSYISSPGQNPHTYNWTSDLSPSPQCQQTRLVLMACSPRWFICSTFHSRALLASQSGPCSSGWSHFVIFLTSSNPFFTHQLQTFIEMKILLCSLPKTLWCI